MKNNIHNNKSSEIKVISSNLNCLVLKHKKFKTPKYDVNLSQKAGGNKHEN